ncbi:hypothetical protein ILUMI_00919 [Ignelater luminosus]|uniref:Uncharacterized protein n=1 Tax=Ignelater luminosus TaxID=2038154 RepID=A0A8K0DLC9_IGNLU|nr:hypothetical protein ILUMI_00919 [Ignelater luminosus]
MSTSKTTRVAIIELLKCGKKPSEIFKVLEKRNVPLVDKSRFRLYACDSRILVWREKCPFSSCENCKRSERISWDYKNGMATLFHDMNCIEHVWAEMSSLLNWMQQPPQTLEQLVMEFNDDISNDNPPQESPEKSLFFTETPQSSTPLTWASPAIKRRRKITMKKPMERND